MDTNTIIELFEELRKQLTSLSRRIDDRNISAPAPVTTDDKIARLLETAQFTRTNVERVRMELADRITTIGKETENHTEKIIAAVAHPAQPAAQRHIHVIDFNTSWALLYMAISFIVILCGGIHITKLYDRIANLRDTELKYRYVQMMGDIDEQKLRNLNALFYVPLLTLLHNRIQSIFLPCRRIIILFQQPFDNTPHSGTSTLLHIPVDRFVTPECIRQLTCNSDQLIVGIEIFYSLRLGQRIIKGKFFAVQIKRLAGLFAENDLTGYFQ